MREIPDAGERASAYLHPVPSTKIDLRRDLGGLYRAKSTPALVEVPELAYLMIDGKGDPNGASFQEAVGAAFSLAYTVRFDLKKRGELDYSVMPLEALWASPGMRFDEGSRESWEWTMLIVQPDAVTIEAVERARDMAKARRPTPELDRVRLERFTEGPAAQVLHVGPYSTEGPTIERLHGFLAESGLALAGRHHEIYLGDPPRSAPERLRTIIRQPYRRA